MSYACAVRKKPHREMMRLFWCGGGSPPRNDQRKRSNIMAEYTTQMDAARKGIVTKEMEIVAEK